MAALEEEDKEPEAPTFSWMPADCVPMADGEYDAIVMGTGLKECIMSGLLSTMGKKARRRRPAFFSRSPRGAAAERGRGGFRAAARRRRGSRTEYSAAPGGYAFRHRFENRRMPAH